jgi:hypothetical protein
MRTLIIKQNCDINMNDLLLPLTLSDGSPLPPRPLVAWREHTGTRLGERHPEAREAALEMVREGTPLAEVARVVGPMIGKHGEGEIDGLRKILRGWIIAAGIDMTEIARRKAALLRDEALDRASELTPHAKVKDLGAVAMILTQSNQVERNLGGMPTDIKVTTKLTMADLERLRQPNAIDVTGERQE